MTKTALITGATSGIGHATVYEFTKNGINLILCGRRLQRLNTIQKALEKLTNVHILNTDRQSGHITNIGSSVGKEVYPKGNVYCASKHAVLAITEGMRIDLNPFGIKVGAVSPGLVETEFSQVRFKGDKIADNVYKGFNALQTKDIAEIIYFAVSRPPHVNIADMLVFPTAQANSGIIKKEF